MMQTGLDIRFQTEAAFVGSPFFLHGSHTNRYLNAIHRHGVEAELNGSMAEGGRETGDRL